MYLYRDYFKAKVYTIWAHGPLEYILKVLKSEGSQALNPKPITTPARLQSLLLPAKTPDLTGETLGLVFRPAPLTLFFVLLLLTVET